jgi:hypothetical protein
VIGPRPYLGALEVAAGETLRLYAARQMEAFLVGLPPVERPAVDSDQYDLEELPAESIPA